MKLIIGNKRYSSWSMRPWVLLKHFQIPFEEILIPLDQPETHAAILKYSPSGKVPALIDGSLTIWESLAIAEYLNEKYPEKRLWPVNENQRANARSVANEMHGGFATMREVLPHDLQKELKEFNWEPAREDVLRVQQIWRECLAKASGPFLFGAFSIADAMYAPVVNRFVSYAIPCDSTIRDYMTEILKVPAVAEWNAAGKNEQLRVPRYE